MKASERIEELRLASIKQSWVAYGGNRYQSDEWYRKHNGGDIEATLAAQFKAIFDFLDEKFPEQPDDVKEQFGAGDVKMLPIPCEAAADPRQTEQVAGTARNDAVAEFRNILDCCAVGPSRMEIQRYAANGLKALGADFLI